MVGVLYPRVQALVGYAPTFPVYVSAWLVFAGLQGLTWSIGDPSPTLLMAPLLLATVHLLLLFGGGVRWLRPAAWASVATVVVSSGAVMAHYEVSRTAAVASTPALFVAMFNAFFVCDMREAMEDHAFEMARARARASGGPVKDRAGRELAPSHEPVRKDGTPLYRNPHADDEALAEVVQKDKDA